MLRLAWSLAYSIAGVAPASNESVRIAVGKTPGSVEIADLNGDGRNDIIVANHDSNDLTVLLGDGRGGLAPAAGSPFAAGEQPNDIAIADFNGDGKLDLAVANHEAQHVSLLRGDGRGGLASASRMVVKVQSKPHPHGVAAGDFNGDRLVDLVVESWGVNRVELLLADGRGSFVTPGPMFEVGRMPYQRLRAADFGNDGHADVVTTNFEGASVSILLGDGKGRLEASQGSPFPCGKTPFGVAIADLNQDKKLDLAVVNYSGEPTNTSNDGVTVLTGDGHGRFATLPGSPFRTGRARTRIATGDVNSDGAPDIVVSNSESQSVTVLLAGKGTFGSSYDLPVGREPKGVAIADVTGDGKAEIVVANARDNDITVIRGK